MIVIGVDVHKHSLTAVAVDEVGRKRAAYSGPVDEQVVGWARSIGGELVWALEDCRHVTRGLESILVAAHERVVRVPPRLTAPQRRGNRVDFPERAPSDPASRALVETSRDRPFARRMVSCRTALTDVLRFSPISGPSV